MPKNKLLEKAVSHSACDKKRIVELELLLEKQAEQYDRMKNAKWSIPKSPNRVANGSFLRVIIPDTHGSHSDPVAISALMKDLKQLGSSVSEVIMLGDHLDCGGFLAMHHTENYVADTAGSFEDDVNATNILLDEIQAALPKARIEYIEGNHERRIEKWCVTQALRNYKDAAYLLKCFGTESQLQLSKRGINFIKQGEFYDGLPIPATIRRGKCFFTHGVRCGKNAPATTLTDFGGCVVFGHVHRAGSTSGSTVHAGDIVAFCPGALCKKQPLWNHTQPTGWSHGYAVQNVSKGGEFMHIQAPICNGESYLMQFIRKIKL